MANKASVFLFADVEVRERELSLTKAGAVLAVEPKAFRALLLRNRWKLITMEELLNAAWGDASVTENSRTRFCTHVFRAVLAISVSVRWNGRKNLKQVPERRLSVVVSKFKVPPCRTMISALIVSPSPVPLRPLVVKNGSRIFFCTSGGIPGPVSEISILRPFPVALAARRKV